MRILVWTASSWPLLLVLFLSVTLRVWRLDELITVGGDLGYDLAQIKGIIDGDLTLLGSPIGRFGDSVLYLAPLYYYLQVPFLAITRFDPVGLAIPIIIGRAITTLFVYLTAKALFNHKAAITAALISALSPYFVSSLGPPSQPYLIPALTAVIIYLLIKTKRIASLGACGFLTGLTVHLHYLGLVLAPAIFLLLFYGARERLKSTIALLAGFFLGISPIILFELRNNLFLTKQTISQITGGVVSTQTQSITSQLTSSINLTTGDIAGISSPAILALVLAAAIVAVKKSTNVQKPYVIFLISIVVFNFVAASIYSPKVQSHYLAASYVPLFIFTGLLISYMAKFHRIIPVILTILVSLVLIYKNDFDRPSGYTMPEDLTLRRVRQISRLIAQDTKGPFNITATIDGDSRALPYRYLVDVYGKKALGVEQYDKGDSLYVITRDPASAVRDNNLFEIASFQPSNVAGVDNITGDIKLIKLSKVEKAEERVEKFVTIINPVRARDLWFDRSIENLTNQLESIKKRGLSSSWLLSYDTLDDAEITSIFKNERSSVEVGALLEVSVKWATDSRVSYKVAEGDYYRPDKVFLSGYSPKDRQKLIKTYFKKFQQIMGLTPKVAGAWYVDARSQNILAKEGVVGLLVVADQFDTDAAASWGKYWSMPFYPSKFNSLQPAAAESLKIPIVNIQWAQRHPIAGYGARIEDSRHSFQANDYINNGFDSSYFDELLDIYLKQQKTDFMQITLGLEAGQEAVTFAKEFEYQLDKIANLRDINQLSIITLSQFSDWYQNKYPGISPAHFVTHQNSFWYMSPKFRVFVTKDEDDYQITDLRPYDQYPTKDYFYADADKFLARYVTGIVDHLARSNSINLGNLKNPQVVDSFDRLTLKADNGIVRIDTMGVQRFSGKDLKFGAIYLIDNLKSALDNIALIPKFSKIENIPVFGLKIADTKLLGFKGPAIGVHEFPFQTLAKFKSPASVFDNYQPWID